MQQLRAVHQDYFVGKVMSPYRDMLSLPVMLGSRGYRGGNWPQGFVSQVPAELSEGGLTVVQVCKDSLIPGPGRGQEDGQGDLCRSQGSPWLHAWSPWRHQWRPLSVLSLPSPTLQVPGPRPQREEGFQAGRIIRETGRTGTVLSRSAVIAVFGKAVLIPFHPLSMAVSCLQARAGRCLKPELLCGPSSHMCSSIHHVVLDPFVGWPGPCQWHLRPPPQLPHLPFYFGLQQARPGMHQPSPPGRKRGEEG